ncbi:hypothetical protein HN873_050181 [Arachis hypogaea]
MEDQYNGNGEVVQDKGNVDSEVHDENNNSVKTTNVLPTKAPQVEGDQAAGHETNDDVGRDGRKELERNMQGHHHRQRHNARTCEEKKKSLRGQTSEAAETASGAANEQEDAADLSDREQEMYYEETLEAAYEQQVTQGHPQFQTDNEQAQGLESYPAAASDSTTTINKSAPPKVAGAVAAAPRLVRRGASSARAKIPIMRPPFTIAPAHDPIRPPQVRPSVAAAPTPRAASVRPNVPFRPPQVRPNVAGRSNIPVKSNTLAQLHVPNSSSSASSLVSHQTMNAASKGTTKRFMKFMHTPAPSKPSQKPRKKP